uniref:Putative secreted protein n=1 Tax=Ixodes ricinus TaxID=34613 RepID=A0A6B0UR59_IXORI
MQDHGILFTQDVLVNAVLALPAVALGAEELAYPTLVLHSKICGGHSRIVCVDLVTVERVVVIFVHGTEVFDGRSVNPFDEGLPLTRCSCMSISDQAFCNLTFSSTLEIHYKDVISVIIAALLFAGHHGYQR